MTEAEWPVSEDPAEMLAVMLTDRKLRLFVCACCRRLWHRLSDPRSRRAVEVAELYLDGRASRGDVLSALRKPLVGRRLKALAFCTCDMYIYQPAVQEWFRSIRTEIAGYMLADVLRDVAGNPFRPVMLPEPVCEACGGEGREHGFGLTHYSKPCRYCPPVGDGSYRGTGKHPCPWLTPTVLALAREAYSDQDRRLVLSDALEEAGCDSHRLLEHLRCREPHVKGCWAVELVLGRTV